jgi:DHA1 family tetracycline resistance protein-like MFS transporter
MAANSNRPRLNPALAPIFLIQLIGAMGYGIMFPLLPYYGKEYGASPLVNGMLLASYGICSFIAGPILGTLSDRYGRRPWLIFSLIGTIVGFALLGIGGSLFMLFLGRMIDGISGGNVVIAQAYISDVSKPEERTQNFGVMGMAFGIGFALGPALGTLLSPYGLSVPMWVAAGLTAVATVVTYLRLPESIKPGANAGAGRSVLGQFGAIGEVFTRASLQPLLLMFLSFTLTAFLFITSISQVMQLQIGAGVDQAGWPATVFGVLNILFQSQLRGIVARLGERRMIVTGLATLLVPSIGMFLVREVWQMVALAPFMALAMTLLRPSLTAMLTALTDPRAVGKVLGVGNSIDALAQIVAPLIGGLLIQAVTPGTPGLLGALIASLGLLIFALRSGMLPARVGGRPGTTSAPLAAPSSAR